MSNIQLYDFTILNTFKQEFTCEPIKLNIVSHKIDYTPVAILIHLHGICGHFQQGKSCLNTFKYKINKLTDLKIISYGLELRGHGKSSGLKFYINNFDEYVSDLHSLVHYIINIHSSIPIYLTGESMGGALAIIYSIKYKNNIKGIGLFSPMIDISIKLPVIIKWILYILSFITPLWELMNPRYGNLHLIDRYSDYIANCEYGFKKGVRLGTCRAFLNATEWIKKNESICDIPIIIFHSQHDSITSHIASKHFIHNCKSTDREFIDIDSIDHDVLGIHNTDNRDEIYNLFYIWLKKKIYKI